MSGRGGHANGTGVPEPDFGDAARPLGAGASGAVESPPVEDAPGDAGETTDLRGARGPSRVPSFIRRLIRSRREVERTVEVVRRAARFLFQSQLPRMAAALSYRTIFGLVPTLVIAIAVLGSFASPTAMQSTLRQILIYTGISEIEIDEERAAEAEREAAYTPTVAVFAPKPGTAATVSRERSPLAMGPSLESSPRPLADAAGTPDGAGSSTANAGPDEDAGGAPAGPVTPKLEDWITEIVSRVRGIAFEAIGAIGVLTLIYAAISMLIEVERAFNDIYHAPAGRAWGRRIPLYWTMLTLGVVLILATFFVGARATEWLAKLTPALAAGTGLGTLVTFIATVLTSMVLLLGVYLWVPNTRVALRPALAGSFVAALLWETGKLGLQRYIEFSTNYAKLYGSLGLLPLLLIWIYVTWLIVLFGLQVAYALQNFQSWRAEDAARDSAPSVIEPAAILAIASHIARGFEQGRAVTLPEVASGSGVDERVAGLMVDRLVEAGVAVRTERPREGFTLARPASQVALPDLLRLGHAMVGGVTGPAAELREQSLRALDGRTLEAGRRVDARGAAVSASTPAVSGAEAEPAPVPSAPGAEHAPKA